MVDSARADGTQSGKIITFYSFKGGVGRTMALANVAFLAAMNGQRVLVMDWDLEAPGLSYYFRGQLDAAQTRNLKDAPGVLDIVWEWSNSLKENAVSSDSLLQRFEEGVPFRDCVRPLLAQDAMPPNGALDFIGAGGRIIRTPEPKRYEEALAEFSWTHFLNQEAGGIVLEALRKWSKSNYDLILLDSRTGLADVAGICTMQLPDIVALCFIFNRQNIDGVAKVAGAIRTGRNEKVQVRAVPMRVARSGTPEEADARARATAELTRIGGFSADGVREDFQSLAVVLADNVPFYETLAPFYAQNPKLDVLTLNYTSLGESLIGRTFEVPEIDPELVQLVRRRLLPKHATLEYVSNLTTMQPERAIDELQVFIESAFEAALNGESLDDDYVAALIDVAMNLTDLTNTTSEAPELQSRTLDLLRELATRRPSKWRPMLIDSLERYLEIFNYLIDSEDELLLLEELDGLLAEATTTSARLRRIEFRRKAAAIYRQASNDEATMQTVGEIRMLLDKMPKEPPLPRDQANRAFFAEIDVELLSGEVDISKERASSAFRRYQGALEKMRGRDIDFDSDKSEVNNFLYQIHSNLTRMPREFVGVEDAAKHAIGAAQTGRTAVVVNFSKLASVVLKASDSPEISFDFLMASLGGPELRSKRMFSNYYGRQVRFADVFIDSLIQLCFVAEKMPTSAISPAFDAVAETMVALLTNLGRRRSTVSAKMTQRIAAQSEKLLEILQKAGLLGNQLAPLAVAHQTFAQGRPRDPTPLDR